MSTSSIENNPLLKTFDTPFQTVPFDSISLSDYLPAIKEGMRQGRQEIENICSNPAAADFHNTIEALEQSGQLLDRVLNIFFPLSSAMTCDEMMEISMEISPMLSDYSSEITMNTRLWERVKQVWDHRDQLILTPEESMLLKTTYDSFVHGGALLTDSDREEFRQLKSELSELRTRFNQNVLKELNTYEIWVEEKELAGLPKNEIEEAKHLAQQKGRPGEHLLTLAQPTYISVMKNAVSRNLREKMYRLYCGRNMHGDYSNMDIIRQISLKRLRIAQLLGFKTYADFSLVDTMARTPSNVYELLNKLRDAYLPAWKREYAELLAFVKNTDGHPTDFKPWDYSYYANLLRKATHDYDEESLRPYFELDNVIKGVFGLATRLYGIEFVERPDIAVYHPDVKAFEVKDSDGSYLGVLYTDFFPRESKSPGAWMTEFKPQWKDADGTDSRPHVTIVMNFTKPTVGTPSLLTPREVQTFLHEFGHSLHGLLSDTTYRSLSGTNVYRDFVELPSQFNENFLTRREFLDSFACHYLTGEPIPQALIDKIVASARFGAAYQCLRQLNFGLIDMAWHTATMPVEDVVGFERNAGKSVELFSPEEGCLVSPQFSHIFGGGYAAGYYSYKWAEVLDADAFGKFVEAGVFNRECAKEFRTHILMKGGTENPSELYRKFRGRDANIDAMLQRDGIKD